MSLGPHVLNATPEALAWAKRARIVKALDRVDVLQLAPPDSVRVFRHYFPQQNLDDPIGAANAIIGALGGYHHPNLYVEVWNEVHPAVAQLKEAVAFLHGTGYKVAGASWGTGDYTDKDWALAKIAGVDAISVHAYWGTQGLTTWHALRYRQFWRPGDPPVILSEVGRDAVEGGLGGWKKDGLTDEQYLAELAAYAAEIAKDSYVLGATPFSSGPTSDWSQFDMDTISARIPTGAPPVVVAPPPKPTGGPPVIAPKPPTFTVGPGVLALMATQGDKPESDEHYVVDQNGAVFKSETFGAKGIYQWNKEANKTVLLPFGVPAPKV